MSENQIKNPYNFAKLKTAGTVLNNPTLEWRALHKQKAESLISRERVERALDRQNLTELRGFSNKFFQVDGIYKRMCIYLAHLYRFDWYAVPMMKNADDTLEKNSKSFFESLHFLTDSNLKILFQNISLKVIKDGAYYGIFIPAKDKMVVQELPINYCRTRFSVEGHDVIEFNMAFFDEQFTNKAYRETVLKSMPDDFKKGYMAYIAKSKKMEGLESGRVEGWYALTTVDAFKFNIHDNDAPFLISTLLALLDLKDAQLLDKQKAMQELSKILVHKIPVDKNGELMFSTDEAADLHAVAVAMLQGTVGIDVFTTFADTQIHEMKNNEGNAARDSLEKMERAVFNEAGIAQNLFNSSGNLATDKSVLNDTGSISPLVHQFERAMNKVMKRRFKNSSIRFFLLETTIYNYQDISKMYKEQVQIGYSKMLPQIALGHNQLEIISAAVFENEVLELSKVMVPPIMSSTMSPKALNDGAENDVGRKALSDDKKTDKTIANREAMS